MFRPRCPKCGSSRVSKGYRPTSVLLRAVGYYDMHCHNCNLAFRGFAIPGTVRKYGQVVRDGHKPRHKRGAN
ncbi:MAG TPA: hypothetical protein VF703_05270 [Pyrinomonadaceae bacterium]